MPSLEVRAQGIIRDGERILLARHARKRRRYWVLPGGHREEGETLEQTLTRELDEEAGLRPTAVSLFSVSEVLLEDREVLDLVFRVLSFEGDPRLGPAPPGLADRRLKALEWVPASELARIAFLPPRLGAEILDAWERDDWEGARYLGNLGPRPG